MSPHLSRGMDGEPAPRSRHAARTEDPSTHPRQSSQYHLEESPLGKGARRSRGDREHIVGPKLLRSKTFGFYCRAKSAGNKKPRWQGGPAGLEERDLGRGLRSWGSLQGRERSATGIAPVASNETTPRMDSS